MSKKEISYNEAVDEMESILARIEEGSLEVDDLSKEVARVSELLNICKDKLANTSGKVDRILDETGDEEV